MPWSTADDVSHTDESLTGSSRKIITVGKWFCVKQLNNIQGIVNVLCDNNAIEPFMPELH